MAQIKINNTGNNGGKKLKIGSNNNPNKTGNLQLNLGKQEKEEEIIEEPKIPVDTGMPEPVATTFDQEIPEEPQSTTMSAPGEDEFYKTIDDVEDLINDEGDDDLGTKEGRKKAKNRKRGKKEKKNKKDKAPKDNKPDTVETRYKAYITRKYITIGCLVLATIALLFFGIYNTFFKHTLTQQEAASYTNSINAQTQVQQWDSGVEGFLQSNLRTILNSNASLNNSTSEYTLTNISVERNLQLSADTLLSFFSADINLNGETTRVFFELPIKIVDDKFTQAGALSMTFREPYSSDSSTVSENEFLDFGKIKISDEESKAFEPVLNNFLTLGYNEKQDVSNIYKGESPIEFNGKFAGIVKCDVYEEDNQLGYNCIAVYNIELPNGFKYKTTNLMKVSKEGSSYVISRIL